MARGEAFLLSNLLPSELRVLYRHARATLCPSFGEGFDYSGVEAMRCGSIVVASDIPAHREIYANAALYFDPYDVPGLADAMRTVLEPAQDSWRAAMESEGFRVSAQYESSVILPRWESLFESLRSRIREGSHLEMNSDLSWEEWGKRDPYFAVLTDPRYRRTAFDDRARTEFFATGQGHLDYLLATIRKNIDPLFAPRSVVEFGCGVGRLLVPFALLASDVVGVDVSDAMLQEARRNCELHEVRNVRLIKSDDQLSGLAGTFDLLHSCIVFQHIPAERGQVILSRLLQFMRPGSIAAIQVLFCNSTPTSVINAAPAIPDRDRPPPPAPTANPDPEIQMNPYDLNRVFLTLQRAGIRSFYADFTDHGGELGVFLFFRLPEQ